MALVDINDLASALGVQAGQVSTSTIERNMFRVKVGERKTPDTIGTIPGDFGELIPNTIATIHGFYFEFGEGNTGDELHANLDAAGEMPAYLRFSLQDVADVSKNEAIVTRKGDATGVNRDGKIVRIVDYHGDRASFGAKGVFPFEIGSTIEVLVSGSTDGNTYTAFNLLPASQTIPLDETTRELQDAVNSAEDWVNARCTIPTPAPAAVRQGALEVAKMLFSMSRAGRGLASEELAEQQSGNLLLVNTLLDPYKTPQIA